MARPLDGIRNTIDDLPEDPQVVSNDYVVNMEHPRFGVRFNVLFGCSIR